VVVVVEGTRTVLPEITVDKTVDITGAVTVTGTTIVLVEVCVPV
jgi:hypothetical protein